MSQIVAYRLIYWTVSEKNGSLVLPTILQTTDILTSCSSYVFILAGQRKSGCFIVVLFCVQSFSEPLVNRCNIMFGSRVCCEA